jgi:hypothetical protein
MSEISVIVVDIDDLKPDDLNPNIGTARGMDALEKSITEDGAGRGIVIDKNLKIIAGHHVVLAAKKAGIKRVRCVQTTGTQMVAVQRTDVSLDSPEGRKMAVRDNRTHQLNLEYDARTLLEMEQRGADLSKFFLDHERAAIIPAFPTDLPASGGGAAPSAKVDRAPGEKTEKGAAERDAAPAGPPPSNAKMAQFFFDGTTYDQFCERLDTLEKRFKTSGTADTILEAMRHVLYNSEAASANHADDQAQG